MPSSYVIRLLAALLAVLPVAVSRPAVADVWYVKADAAGASDGTTWADAFTDLQSALDAGGPGDEIWVAAGTYTPSARTDPDDPRTATFQLKNGVALYGGFAGTETDRDARDPTRHETILSGDLVGNDGPDFANNDENSYHVLTAGGTDPTATVDGFTVTGGNADSPPHSSGGGVYNKDGNPTVIDCTFAGNFAGGGGGTANGWMTQPTIRGCTFVGNAAVVGGGMHNDRNLPSISGCSFVRNVAEHSGGGIWGRRTDGAIVNCIFLDNVAGQAFQQKGGGGALHEFGETGFVKGCIFRGNRSAARAGALSISGKALVTDCAFYGNRGVDGGAVWAGDGGSVFANCVFSGNSALRGGALYNERSRTVLIQCTLTHNVGRYRGGGLFNSGSSPIIANCILWGNDDARDKGPSAQIHNTDSAGRASRPEVTYTCIEGGWPGSETAGVIDADPRFVREPIIRENELATQDGNDDFGDLRLGCDSPCLDAGNAAALPRFLPTDLDGNPRILESTVDMGAFEGANQAFRFTERRVVLPEGGTATFSILLACDPVAPITATVTRAAGDPDILVQDGISLTFHPADSSSPRHITLGAAPDADAINGTAIVQVAAMNIGYGALLVQEADDEPLPPALHVDAAARGARDGTSWADAFTDLQGALALAANRRDQVSEIWVAAGTYYPDRGTGDRSATFRLQSGLGLYGGFVGTESERRQRDPARNVTILSGDLGKNDVRLLSAPTLLTSENKFDNSYHVVTGRGVDPSAVLAGFIITGGYADTEPLPKGGGIFNDHAAPTVRDCIFRQNWAFDGGGGLYSEESTPHLVRCTFDRNGAFANGGAMADVGGAANLVGCTFVANRVEFNGGGIFNLSSRPTLSSCTFEGNSAFGARGLPRGRSTLGEGGAVYNVRSEPSFLNCTLAGNFAFGRGAAIFNREESHTILRNGIVWGNRAGDGNDESPQIFNESGEYSLEYTCIEGLADDFPGRGNIGDDPRFAKSGEWDDRGTSWNRWDDVWLEGDYRLRPGSPAINAGDPRIQGEVGETDLDGRPRVQGGRVDMGAFETPWAQGDADFDGDVDLADLLAFLACARGADAPPNNGCERFDFDGDGDVDLSEFVAFQAAFTGAR